MGKFKSLPESPVLADVFKRFPQGVWQLCEFHDVRLRGNSPLSVAERELIAAYVSGLNACNFCFNAHSNIAAMYGVDTGLYEKLMADPTQADIDAKLLPLLAYVKKLTEAPSKVTAKDAEAVYAAGWDEQALFDAVTVCALFNFMNRIIEGTGVVANATMGAELQKRFAVSKDDPEFYRNFARSIGITGH